MLAKYANSVNYKSQQTYEEVLQYTTCSAGHSDQNTP